MVNFKEITQTRERKPEFTDRHIILPRLTNAPFGSEEHEEWVKNNWWMLNYGVFKGNKKKALELSRRLDSAFKQNPNHPLIPKILAQLRKIELRPTAEMTPLERWRRNGHQFVDYCGGYDVYRIIRRRLDKYSGIILEAMCGHLSYFEETPKRRVTALDYCLESLEKYPVPGRRRIECDLNQIRGGARLSFFSKGQFDAISVCFGFKYPEDLDALAKEFLRILRRNGTLSFVENPRHGYQELCRRKFSRNHAKKILGDAGFRSVKVSAIPMPAGVWNSDRGIFYHTEAIK